MKLFKVSCGFYVVLISILFWSCRELPTDPMLNYDNVSVSVSSKNNVIEYYAGDSVTLTIHLSMPHLIGQIMLSVNGKDSTINCNYAEMRNDSFVVRYVFTTPGVINYTCTALLKNGSLVTNKVTYTINGIKPVITLQNGPLFLLRPGDVCTLKVEATGSMSLSYQWKLKNTSNDKDTLPYLILPALAAKDTGAYTCIVKNSWGSDTSTPISVLIRETSKKVFWNFGTYRDSIYEGDSLKVSLQNLFTKPSLTTVTFSIGNTDTNAAFSGDSLFIYKTTYRSAGSYTIKTIIHSETESDTSQFIIKVLPKLCTLTITTDSGSVIATPSAQPYRLGDTVTLQAIPKTGFAFLCWNGIDTSADDTVKIVINGNLSITAKFWALSSSTGNVIEVSGSDPLNEIIRQASIRSTSVSEVKTINLAPGTYTVPKIKVYGKVKIYIQ